MTYTPYGQGGEGTTSSSGVTGVMGVAGVDGVVAEEGKNDEEEEEDGGNMDAGDSSRLMGSRQAVSIDSFGSLDRSRGLVGWESRRLGVFGVSTISTSESMSRADLPGLAFSSCRTAERSCFRPYRRCGLGSGAERKESMKDAWSLLTTP